MQKAHYNKLNIKTKFESLFLINKNWVDQYEYEEINNWIKNNNNIINEKNEIIKSNSYCLESLNNIIIKLDYQSLIKIDQKLQMKKNITVPFKAEYDSIKLTDNKKVIIFKNFILINKQIMDIFNQNFKDSLFSDIISYSKEENNDIISISINYQIPNQNTIFIGNINNDSYSFNINYILDFKSYYILNNEEKYLSSYGINNYITNKTVFNNNKDYFSPIFNSNEIIGFCYKYKSNADYNKYTDYYNLMSNKIFINSFYLNNNYQKISKMINDNSSSLSKQYFYLINKKVINDIKIDYNFKEFYELMEKKNIPSLKNQKKEFYSFISTLP